MREIKFRGYNSKNGLWLYGSYVQNRGHHFVCPDEFANGKWWDDYEVEKDTIGQSTGLKDKDGREIFEGDAIDAYDYYGRLGNLSVEWDEEKTRFVFSDKDGYFLCVNEITLSDSKIIGNIYNK